MIRFLTAASILVAAPLAAQTGLAPPPAVAELKASAAPADKDATYVFHARDSDRYEIASSRWALQRSRNREVRAFAQLMINHHTRSSAELARLHTRSGLGAPEPQSEPKAQMLQKLRDSSRTEFDRNYVQGQLGAHEEALDLHRTYAATGQNPVLREFARRAAALVQGHLTRTRSLPRPAR